MSFVSAWTGQCQQELFFMNFKQPRKKNVDKQKKYKFYSDSTVIFRYSVTPFF